MPIPSRNNGYYDYTFTQVVTGNTSYFTTHVFVFEGTDTLGAPISISSICGIIDNGAVLWVRIYDVTNNQVIAEKTGITSTFPTIVDLGALNNLPTNMSVWEVQILSQNLPGPDGEVAVASLFMRF